MEEKELTQRFHGIFEKVLPILENVEKGFFTNNAGIIKKCSSEFDHKLTENLPFIEKIVAIKDKDPVEIRYVNMVLSLQAVFLAAHNLIDKMFVKTDGNILFSEKALKEIRYLFEIMKNQLRDTKDYISTRNPHLKNTINASKEKLIELAAEYDLVHQNRLITGICMPKASYLYIEMTESLKRVARGLVDFAEKV